jgi:hypothetical protein
MSVHRPTRAAGRQASPTSSSSPSRGPPRAGRECPEGGRAAILSASGAASERGEAILSQVPRLSRLRSQRTLTALDPRCAPPAPGTRYVASSTRHATPDATSPAPRRRAAGAYRDGARTGTQAPSSTTRARRSRTPHMRGPPAVQPVCGWDRSANFHESPAGRLLAEAASGWSVRPIRNTFVAGGGGGGFRARALALGSGIRRMLPRSAQRARRRDFGRHRPRGRAWVGQMYGKMYVVATGNCTDTTY